MEDKIFACIPFTYTRDEKLVFEYDDENINADKFDADSDDDPVADEVFKRTVVKLKKKPLMKLSEIEDFDELRFE